MVISISDPRHTDRLLKSHKSKIGVVRNVYAIMKTMWPPGYHHSGFVATHALWHLTFGSNGQK